tara:strand:+ start:562 stop:828 length:267 start_codon:yes stop_codon:yes gene_type:complete
MKSKKQINPVDALSKTQRDKMGKAVGSMLEGGRIKFNRTPEDLFKLSAKAKRKSDIALDEGRFRKSDRLNRKANRLDNKAIMKQGLKK